MEKWSKKYHLNTKSVKHSETSDRLNESDQLE